MNVTLRPAVEDDCALLFNWVNAPDSLSGKLLTQGLIARGDHDQWFAARLSDADTMIRIVERKGVAVGQVRLTWQRDAYEIDVYVAPDHRKAGIAAAALTQAMSAAAQANPERASFRALVRRDNKRSRELFERLGFTQAGQKADHMTYTLTPKT